MTFGVLRIDPARNPAILDTATWSPDHALAAVESIPSESLGRLGEAIQTAGELPTVSGITTYPGSLAARGGSAFALAGLADGQYVVLEFRSSEQPPQLPGSLLDIPLTDDTWLGVHAADAETLHRYVREIAPTKGPRALGNTPRLGIGSRMTAASWPGVFRAMDAGGFAANAVQNSVRELNFLADVLEGSPPDKIYYSGGDTIESGHTGSTFEGLWVRGTIEALKYPKDLPFGADADHIQVKRGAEGMSRAKRYLESCRHYTFYTMDMADILDYESLREPSDAAAADRALHAIGDEGLHRRLVSHHRGPWQIGSRTFRLSEPVVDRMLGKYWGALEAMTEVNSYLGTLRSLEPYDLEFTIDEHPPEIRAFDCLTSDEECVFVVKELARRGLPVTHLAPNTGVEKGFDYRGADGLDGLERRLASLSEILASHGLLIDVHSADDLSAPTRAAIRRGTGGKLHYKVAPVPQILFAGVVEDLQPEVFRDWWSETVAYAREEAARGSQLARWCLEALDTKGSKERSHRDLVFHHYAFRFVGRRDAHGQFINRERLYSLTPAVYREYEERLVAYLTNLAGDLL